MVNLNTTNWKVALAASAALAAASFSGGALAQDVGATPTYGTVNLNAGFLPDPSSVDLQAGGNVSAYESIGGNCFGGQIADAPDVNLVYTPGSLPLYLSVTSDADTTLVVNTPDGQWHCNDDTNGLNPGLAFDNPQSGLYNIWVGTFSSSAGYPEATLHISELWLDTEAGTAPDTPTTTSGLDYTLPPNFGSVTLTGGFAPDPHAVSINAGGSVSAEAAVGAQCRGYVSEAPDYSVNYTAGGLPLYFSIVADRDTTLVINDPNGNWYCDDDGGEGLNPQLVFNNPESGRYDVWVGTYSQLNDFPVTTLYVSELGRTSSISGKSPSQGLDFTLDPNFGSVTLTSGFLPDPHTVGIAAGGSIDVASDLGGDCWGWASAAPDYSVNYTSGFFPLSFIARSSTDTVLIVNDPNGEWHCNDDGAGYPNPQVDFPNPASGRYDVWVGTFSQQQDYPAATLEVTEIAYEGGGTSATGSIDWSLSPSYGTVNLSSGFLPDPHAVSVAAGGSQDASQLGDSCWGYVAAAPDVNLEYSAGNAFDLYISASSTEDLVLVVNTPDGQWHCNDDYSGLNPALMFENPMSGQYNIWVGTYSDQPDLPPATLYISELEANF